MDSKDESAAWLLKLADGRVAALRTAPTGTASKDEAWFEVPPYLLRGADQIFRKLGHDTSTQMRTYVLHPDDEAMLDRFTTFTDENGWSRAFAHRDGRFAVNARLREVVGDFDASGPPVAFDPASAILMLQLAQIQRSLKRIEARLDEIGEQVEEVLDFLRRGNESRIEAWVNLTEKVYGRLRHAGMVTNTDREELYGAQQDLQSLHLQARNHLDGVVDRLAVDDSQLTAAAAVKARSDEQVRREMIQEWITLKALAQLVEIRAAVRAQRDEHPQVDEADFVLDAIKHMKDRSDRLGGIDLIFDPTIAQRVDAAQQRALRLFSPKSKTPQIASTRSKGKRRSRDGKATGGAAAGLGGAAAGAAGYAAAGSGAAGAASTTGATAAVAGAAGIAAASIAAAAAAPAVSGLLVHVKAKRDQRHQSDGTMALEGLKALFAMGEVPHLEATEECINLSPSRP